MSPVTLPGVVLPRFVTELTRPRNHMELPLEVTAPGVEGEDVARDVFDAGLVIPLFGRVADHHHSVHHDRRRRGGDVAQLSRDAVIRIVRAVVGRATGPNPR